MFFYFICARPKLGHRFFMNHHSQPIEVGKYRVSPLATQTDAGSFAASVSIRSGRGSATHDRVSRFSTLFDNAPAALHYATEHALAWIGERSPAAHA
jgi:hypothetical protein